MNRRSFIRTASLTLAAGSSPALATRVEPPFRLRYVLSSAMYGDLPLDQVLAAAGETGSGSVDIWRKVHATHREQISEIGDEAFQNLLEQHGTRMSISTCYPLGPFKQDDEMRWVKKNGGRMTVCASGSMGPGEPKGAEAERQVKAFFEKLKPHYELAGELGVTMAIENHKNSMLSTPDSIRCFAEFNPSQNVGVALAPHHLHDVIEDIPQLIRELGRENIPFIYCQEHHPSSMEKMSKEDELKQLPGFGTLDYVPILGALKEIGFDGLAEIFMHPVPRGIPVLPTAGEVNALINRSRSHLNKCLELL